MTGRAPALDLPAAAAMGWRGLWTPARARLWLIAAMVAAWLPAVGVPLRGWLDFSAFYAAGALAFTPDVARLGPIVAFQVAHDLPITPFVYPAGVALAYVPFAQLPYGMAAALHLVLMAAALIGGAMLGARLLGLERRWAVIGAGAWGPAAAGVLSGQNTALALLVTILAAAALAQGRDRGAGALTGLLTWKPQLAAPIVGLLVLRRRPLALVVVVAALGAQYIAGVLATGGDLSWPGAWWETLRAYSTPDFRANGWQAISLPALGHHLELATGLGGLTALGYLLGGLLVAAYLPAMRRLPTLEAVALACACGLVVSPHAWVYDATLLLPAVAVLAARAKTRGWSWRDRWQLAAAFAIALTWPIGGVVGATLIPLLVIAAPVALAGPPTAWWTRPQASPPAVGSLPLGQ